MGTWIYALFIGLVAGLIADYLRKDQSYGLVINTIIGVLGAGLGWWLVNTLGLNPGKNLVIDILVALVGSSILLALISLFKKRA